MLISNLFDLQFKVLLNPAYAPSISKDNSLASPSPSSSCAFIPFNRINQLMIFALPSKSRSVTAFTLCINSASSGWSASFESMFSFKASRKVMKFSVASRIWEPDAEGAEGAEEGWGVDVEGCEEEGSAIVAGRLTRRRSVARGHSIWDSSVSY